MDFLPNLNLDQGKKQSVCQCLAHSCKQFKLRGPESFDCAGPIVLA